MVSLKVRNPFSAFTIGRLFLFLLGTLALVQVFSLVISFIVKDVEIFKGGQLLIILSIIITFTLLVKLVFKSEFQKVDLIYVILMGLVTFLLFQYGNTVFPQIFSFFGTEAVTSAHSLASVLGLP